MFPINLEITDTVFGSKSFEANATNDGVSLGQGKCKAVRLQLPKYDIYTSNVSTDLVVWYGDANQQPFELLQNANNTSGELIFCNDLSEVFILTNVACIVNYIIYN